MTHFVLPLLLLLLPTSLLCLARVYHFKSCWQTEQAKTKHLETELAQVQSQLAYLQQAQTNRDAMARQFLASSLN